MVDFLLHIAASPPMVRLWVYWMVAVMTFIPLTLMLQAETRRLGLILLLVGAVTAALMVGLFNQVGFVRLLGLPHILVWTPLLVWLIAKLRRGELTGGPRTMIIVVAATIAVSLVFDYIDVIRYILGDRAPMV
ncbi:hypothetical protein DDZ14_17825 [Maritimibacter sp. 55A14]|uniref:hypothetical protein n=1 Tax=Maritimibacter sp. 55A14 TaxID=2174844 RepID=UPI000D6101BB|nr:hypothetical protein [Maritimibacter sp. 55A14]PWE29292.1 hypothetical protein DDZ14_17825 [Maritimibacter sp. 55A14]